MSKILVAVSSALAAERLVKPVADMAQKLSAEVLVIHVSRPSAGQGRESEEAEGDRAVRTLQDGIAATGINVTTLLMFSDDIAKAILNTADEQNATLLCLGLTGKNVFARLLAGNVPVELIRNTKVPVLLFPPELGDGI
ncbi:MAG: UspA family protein [Phycisphaerales bacterium]|jgi:nucleotide-binding universal stress UspA family protein|nr:UspA family protein [Phycisphaerales bacterium]